MRPPPPAHKIRPRRIVRATPPAPVTLGEHIDALERRLRRAGLCYGHGTDNPADEAASLVLHAAGCDYADLPAAYHRPLEAGARATLERLVARRIDERVPAPYLTGRVWFAGHEIRVDERVLVPRSPLAEFIVARAAPFLREGPVTRILDLGTGSGCIAIAAAHAFPEATVDASDISRDALAVARDNVRRHGLARRLHLHPADVYLGLGAARYDMILANPPYVPEAVVDALPAEYGHEPRGGLASGADGLDVVRRILSGAAERLTPRGLLVGEVGDSDVTVARTWPTVPFLWLEFANGGGGVFLVDRETLIEHAAVLAVDADAPRARKSRVR